MPLVLTERCALKREVVQQRVSRAADQDLDRPVLVDSAVALPDMPPRATISLTAASLNSMEMGNLVGLWSTGSAPTKKPRSGLIPTKRVV